MLALCRRAAPCLSKAAPPPPPTTVARRHLSNSPYGRTHVWKRRAPVLPNPVVPKFPQRVIRSDGTSFVHWTTSPKSLVRLARDTTNNPLYNPAAASDRAVEEESSTTGRLGRFNRRFEDVGSTFGNEDTKWIEDMAPPVVEVVKKVVEVPVKKVETKGKGKGKK
ncbi:hypothetical protein D9611_000719 [Ephemerocybe angulata]|uniref:Uncharacterized protein n=1 Tax=Ephemerocybe angulata TaxID=980116 RepID=A0A8H5F7Q3_9AGAR|nr:hypothetical protein D9611_000719 [Tulosesus angulatus]